MAANRRTQPRAGIPGRRCAPALALLALAALCAATAPLAGAGEPEEIDDKKITRAIQSELELDRGVSAHLIDVETSEGIVTLSGSVDNALAKDRAVAIAQSVRGVRAVVDRVRVKPPHRPDKELKDDIVEALAVDPAAETYELAVEVNDGVAELSGTVQSWAEKHLAEQVAKGVRGVKSVTSNIRIVYPREREDDDIRAGIRRRLDSDIMVDAGLIDIKVYKGKVTLSGTVGSAAERQRAWQDAWVAGVKSVNAQGLEVRAWARDEMQRKRKRVSRSDEEIQQAVEEALVHDPRVFSFRPEVEVDEGIVTLTGEVTDLGAKRAAEETAANTLGVWRVVNRLRVRPEKRPTDETLQKRIARALQRDPYVERHQIRVVVLNGKAHLYGTVDSEFEHDQAESVAADVKGVVAVANHLYEPSDWQWRDDWRIRKNVESQLWWSPFVDSEDVTVTVDEGVATLKGTVGSERERRAAAENARQGGAKEVRNRLRVKGEDERTPGYPWWD